MQATTRLLQSIPVDELTGAIAVPIYQTATFVQESPGVNKGFDYSRTNNPTRQTLEKIVAQLEGGEVGIAFSSGLAAIDAVLKLLESGDEIIAVDDIYGGAFRLFEKVYRKFGVSVRYVDTTDLKQVFAAITPRTKLIWLETPTNPTLKISDIAAIARLAKQQNIFLCVDSTFASPAGQLPLSLGADIVVHSATKYIGGHSDVIAGVVITRTRELGDRIRFYQNACGAILSPFDSFLLIRGIETLHLRIKAQSGSAQAIAEFLHRHPAVDKVYYPGLPSHPGHALAARQQQGFGAIVSFTLRGDSKAAALALVTHTVCFNLAESLGGVKSLVAHPATMTHASIPEARRHEAGVTDSLIRLSVGLEEAEDLINDLDAALQIAVQHPVNDKTQKQSALSKRPRAHQIKS